MSDPYHLSRYMHTTPWQGRCAMEWVAYLAGEKHTDRPECVSSFLRNFTISLNDNWPDEQRQKLRPYLARCIGTRNDGLDVERVWKAKAWIENEYLPIRRSGWKMSMPPAPSKALDSHTNATAWAVICGKVATSMLLNEEQERVLWPSVLRLLDSMLPTEPLELPSMPDWKAVCFGTAR